ncbi:type III polyketide synthase [Cellulomonas fengjieae]|uniref:Type III polyketide synthase n=1 Tax=Cellulomonas fengjieae TaxID=2819978 RepID=A0ABS3SFV1_9CELL|nr:3-oxoacyl-[acyl-carrier-protein] synthase III C-terminal domain-containing protein [Cellulomonas fengjieae]MBO3084633.1 type III polyketide synthase [Cellulomonas fengjieae]MBO3103405.1 type III polyketide synthase [Cellulomonas fengjieae]QVI67042.1 type III polyketide synthase [Cellulomonas fengjieae]
MVRIASVAPVLPEHVHAQSEITATIAPLLSSDPRRRATIARIHAATGVETRHLALPLGEYAGLTTFTAANEAFVRVGTALAADACRQALDAAGLVAADVDFLLFTSITGIAAPSVDALLVDRLGLRADVKRLPVFGLGCVAGAAGIARVRDYLQGHPQDVALLVSVELCSLTLQQGDDSMANIVSSGLFGDGAAAAVMVGSDRAHDVVGGVDVVDTRSAMYPDTAGALGWDIGSGGFRIVLAAGLAEIVECSLGPSVVHLLAAHGLKVADVGTWVAHTGGPRILRAAANALELPDETFEASWRSLARVGNLSSSGVLHVLADELATGGQIPRSAGVLFAIGPGVCTETVLLRWPEES